MRGSAKIVLIESHAKLAWDCTPCMGKMLLKYLLQFGFCCLLLHSILTIASPSLQLQCLASCSLSFLRYHERHLSGLLVCLAPKPLPSRLVVSSQSGCGDAGLLLVTLLKPAPILGLTVRYLHVQSTGYRNK